MVPATCLHFCWRSRCNGVFQVRPLLPAPAVAPVDSRCEEQHVMAARRQLSTQPRSTSGAKGAPQKQTVGRKIIDPLWQYAALAVYPERLKARRAAA